MLNNHSNDATGADGEAQRPIWFDEMQLYYEWKESQTNQNQNQQAHRADMRSIQHELGTTQAPLGPGNPTLRSEVAAENPTARTGPQELAATIQVAATTINGGTIEDS